DAISLCRLGDLLRAPGQRQDRRVEGRDIGFEHLRRVALGIDGDEYGTDRAALWSKLVERDCDVVERRGAGIRAMRIAEIDERPLSFEIDIGDRLAVLVDEPEGTADRAAKRRSSCTPRRIPMLQAKKH